MGNPVTDEELLRMLENSDDDFGLSSGTDLGEGDSGDDDADPEWSLPKVQPEEDNQIISDVPITSTSGYAWSNRQPIVTRIPFSKSKGLKVFPQGNEPIDYFNLLFDDRLFELIVNETNKNAVQVLLSGSGGSSSRITAWKDTNIQEMKLFIGLLFHTGSIRLNRLEDYWKTSELFNIHFFRQHMSRNRFMLILRNLHFVDNENCDNSRLNKIEPIVTYFYNKMTDIYEASENLSLDESMVLFRGRLVFRQYIKNKRHKYGIKLYMLTESGGLVHRIMIYSGQGQDTSNDFTHTEYVVVKLMEGLTDCGRSLYMDNYYNSVKLAHTLLVKGTYCTGTLRANRKGNPKEITSKKLKVGESVGKYTEEGVCVMKWRDRREVLAISSEHTNDLVEVTNRRGEQKLKPMAITMYNKYMSGIDRQDQMLSYYPCERKTIRWYKKIGIHFFQLLLLNSYYIYVENVKKCSLYDFRLSVITELAKCQININVPPALPSKITNSHIPTKVAKNQKKNFYRKRCKVCHSKGIRKTTIFYCSSCEGQPGLCLENCFEIYHA